MSNLYLDKLQLAITKREVELYLLGKDKYHFPNRWAEEPTDLGSIFSLGLNEYVKLYGQNEINAALEHAILKLLNDPIGTWWVMEILYTYEFGFIENTLLFRIDTGKIIHRLNQCLIEFKHDLIQSKEWAGSRFDNGLWGAIENLASKHNLKTNDPNLIIIAE
jgi:hypothetical protein